MEDKIKKLLEEVTSIPVLEQALPDIFPCITFHIYNESGVFFGAGTATEEGASCQVDIWYKKKIDAIKADIKAIKQVIVNERYFSFPTIETTYETNSKIYHTYINFDLIKESEE